MQARRVSGLGGFVSCRGWEAQKGGADAGFQTHTAGNCIGDRVHLGRRPGFSSAGLDRQAVGARHHARLAEAFLQGRPDIRIDVDHLSFGPKNAQRSSLAT